MSKQSELLRELVNVRDLLRTGLKPDSLNLTNEEWLQHKINRASRELTEIIAKVSAPKKKDK